MTIAEALETAQRLRPEGLTRTEALRLLSRLDGIIASLTDGKGFAGYPDDAPDDTELCVPFPFDGLYTEYLSMAADERENDTALYASSRSHFERALGLWLTHLARSGGSADTRIKL